MTPNACPENAISPEGSFEPTNCKCAMGFENTAYDFGINWFVVGPGTYDEVKEACVEGGGKIASINSNAETRTAAAVCDAGVGEWCYIGMVRDAGGENNYFYWDDGHEVVYSAFQIGEPKLSGPETKVVMNHEGTDWNDWGTGTDKFKGVCKKLTTAPVCQSGYGPASLGMHSGFLVDFYFLPTDISEVPNDYIATATPSFEDVENTILYENIEDFKKVVGTSMPENNFAVTWTGMLKVETEGDYKFFVKSKPGSHLWVDGTMVHL